MAEPRLEWVTGSFTICSACLDGEGGECHTPGCVMWLNRAPDLPLRANLLMHDCRIEDLEARASVSGAPGHCDPIFNCRAGWHEIGCEKRPPDPVCTCKMPIGFGRSFKGFMAPDPKCPAHASAPGVSAGGDEGEPRCAVCGRSASDRVHAFTSEGHGFVRKVVADGDIESAMEAAERALAASTGKEPAP